MSEAEIPIFGAQPKPKTYYIKERILYPELFKSDTSVFPSYTNLKLPYGAICRERYHNTTMEYIRQFDKEINLLEELQTSALDGVRLHRVFCDSFVVPKPGQLKSKLSPKERRRIEEMLKE